MIKITELWHKIDKRKMYENFLRHSFTKHSKKSETKNIKFLNFLTYKRHRLYHYFIIVISCIIIICYLITEICHFLENIFFDYPILFYLMGGACANRNQYKVFIGRFEAVCCCICCLYTLDPGMGHFSFMAVLKSKLTTFWYIFAGTFYRKHIKFVGTLIFTVKNRLVFFVFQ